VAQDANLRRITVSNDDGDVYVESSGDGSEIVLKTEKVRVDGDVYCEGSQVGLSARIDAVFPPKCVRPGGDKLQFDGSEWLCICNGAFGGETCETTWTPEARVVNVTSGFYSDYSSGPHMLSSDGDKVIIGGVSRLPMILQRTVSSDSTSSQISWTPVWNFSSQYIWVEGTKYDKNSFGASVALEGDVALIGAPQQYFCLSEYTSNYQYCNRNINGAGFALMFALNGATNEWELSSNLTASDSVYEYKYYYDEWEYQMLGEDASYQTQTTIAQIRFGTDVALSGDYALVSSSWASFSYSNGYENVNVNVPGAAYVFKKTSENEWSEQAKLVSDLGNTTNDNFGQSIDIFGDVAVVGASSDNEKGSGAGAAYVFSRSVSDETWRRDAKLIASDASSNDRFGQSVAVSGNYVFVGAPYDDENGSESGSVYVFKRDASTNTWSQTAKLTASNAAPNDQFGTSVAVNGDRALVGAPYKASAFGGSGVVYVFERNVDSDEWTETLAKLTDFKGLKSEFGKQVSLSSEYAVGGFISDDYMSSEQGAFVVIANVSSIP